MQYIDGIPVWGEHEPSTLAQIKRCAQTADYSALMADGHKGYAVPIGGVVAYRDRISPSGVGFDIGCGNKAVLTDAKVEDVLKDIPAIMDELVKTISFGVGRSNNESVDHSLFDSELWSVNPQVTALKPLAHRQLGTVGSGNHYVDLFRDEQDRVWIGVHFGSRGLGHKIATLFLGLAGAKDGMDVDPCVINANDSLGIDYLMAMTLAGEYAYVGRDWVCSKVAGILGANILSEVHNYHNFAWRETHNGEQYYVVRKGATPAFPGQLGFVGGSMGEGSVILRGVESTESQAAFYSTVHGAGRVLGRMEAKGKYKHGVCVRPPKVDAGEWYRQMQMAQVELRGGGLDEAPACYKRLPEVLAHHANTIEILHHLTPIGVAMAGSNEFDPYKD